MTRIAQIVLTAVVTLTACSFLSINTGSALAQTAGCTRTLSPGESCNQVTTGFNELQVRLEMTDVLRPTMVSLSNLSRTTCTYRIELTEQAPVSTTRCNPQQGTVSIANLNGNVSPVRVIATRTDMAPLDKENKS